MRSEPESRSGIGVRTSITSTRCRTRCSQAMRMSASGAGCVASASRQRARNLPWFTTWYALVPDDVSVPELTPSKCTTTASGWYSTRNPAARTFIARSVSS